ncbi:MAG: hypothetical protein OJF59_003232 [Cytophagales bacterium]|jgi:hypothetical protein|nr:hypothetical protein [Bacteroidota bacterium]MBS1982021.1 hypothetical protein [Bacteroidota bacterium]WHZ09476.1 MAG: hypothetical protein OJF59_003232 [Cytophagales bacterium]
MIWVFKQPTRHYCQHLPDGYKGYLVTLGLTKKLSPGVSMVSENNFIVNSPNFSTNVLGFISLGLRLGKRRHNFDLAVFTISNLFDGTLSGIIPIPFIGYNLKITK